MQFADSLIEIVKSSKATMELLHDIATRLRKREARAKLRKRLHDNQGSYAIHPYYVDDLLRKLDQGEAITYADLCENIFRMVFVRHDIVMRLEKLLSKPRLSREDVIDVAPDIGQSIHNLRELMEGFYFIIGLMKDAKFASLPIDINKMLAETNHAIESVAKSVTILDAFRTVKGAFYGGEVDDSEQDRVALHLFCEEMKRTVTYLCDMKLVPQN
jgi:hypothetical protein